jgi:hypothetical protein
MRKQMFRHTWYQSLFDKLPEIQREAAASAERLGLNRFKDRIGTYHGSSGCAARLPGYVLDAIVQANQIDVLPARKIADEMRDLVKQAYGDDYDVCVTNTAEAALRVSFETLCAPPSIRKGEQFRGRVLQIFGEDAEWAAAMAGRFRPNTRTGPWTAPYPAAARP